MKPIIDKALQCSVFGHNYVKSKTNADYTSELKCSHCEITINTDVRGNFDESSISNKKIQSTLRQLFHLNMRLSKPEFNT